jgi:DNA-binding NtrC family response regulator
LLIPREFNWKRSFVTTQGTPLIFIVDDEWIIAQTLAIILQHSGFSARFFNNPLEALSAAKLTAPDLLISDVVMPQLSGTDLAIQMKELCPLCNVLLFSGQAQTANLLMKAREQGHNFELLSKPIHPDDLLRNIREQDASWTATRPLPLSA